jgi:hypothetical protein
MLDLAPRRETWFAEYDSMEHAGRRALARERTVHASDAAKAHRGAPVYTLSAGRASVVDRSPIRDRLRLPLDDRSWPGAHRP